jgi:hypothetical protein
MGDDTSHNTQGDTIHNKLLQVFPLAIGHCVKQYALFSKSFYHNCVQIVYSLHLKKIDI